MTELEIPFLNKLLHLLDLPFLIEMCLKSSFLRQAGTVLTQSQNSALFVSS